MGNSDNFLRNILPTIYPDYPTWSGKRHDLFLDATKAVQANISSLYPEMPFQTAQDWINFFALDTGAPDHIPVPDIIAKMAMEMFDAAQPIWPADPYTAVTFGRWQRWTKSTRKAWVKVIDATISESGIPWSVQQVGNTFAWLYDADYNKIEHIDTSALTRVHTLRKQYAKTIKRHKTQKAIVAIVALAVVVAAIVVVASATAVTATATTAVPASGGIASIISTATGLSPATAGLIATAATGLVEAGIATKPEAAAAAADVAVDMSQPIKSSGINPITIVLVVGGITLTGLAVLIIKKRSHRLHR